MGKVSIIVAYYNEEMYIKDCVESIINQTYNNIEVILINDGSVDNSFEISEGYAHIDNRIKNYTINNSGVSIARNRGLEKVTGDYIMFVDGDDWIENNTVEFALNEMKKSEADILIWSYFQSFKNRQVKVPLISTSNLTYHNDEEKQELYMKSIYGGYGEQGSTEFVSAGAGSVMCKLYKSNVIQTGELRFNPKLIRAEDVVFALEAFQYAGKIRYVNESLYHYRKTGFSAVSPKDYMIDADTKYGLLLDRLIEFQDIFIDKEKFNKVFYARTIQALLWNVKHKYFHREHPENIFKMRKQLLEIIKTEPFKTALIKVDKSILPKQENLMVELFKKKLVLFYYVFQKTIDKRDKGKSDKFK